MPNFSGLTKFEFINHHKFTFFSTRTFPRQVKNCALLLQSRVRERDSKNIFYYLPDIENYTDQLLNFLLFDRNKYVYTESSSTYTYSILILQVYLTFSLFFKILLTLKMCKTFGESILDESKESVINSLAQAISLKQSMFISIKY